MSKVLVCPYFGELPPWFRSWCDNIERLLDHDYQVLIDTDEAEFKKRVWRKLGIECPDMWGTGNIWDFRPAFGELYAEEIGEAEFWGHTDFDCVYGRVERWMTDEYLAEVDLYSNHPDYVCGPWSLYRNIPKVNSLFRQAEEWEERMESKQGNGWVEMGYTDTVNEAAAEGVLRVRYELLHCFENTDKLRSVKGKLMDGEVEVMMAHFRRTKRWPVGV